MVAPSPLTLGALVILGIDEAGRGAVLGPLVVAGVLTPEGKLARLRELGARDSKTVPREKRRGVLAAIAREFRVRAVVIPARVVDQESLTELELAAATDLIRRALSQSYVPITRHPSPVTVVMDAPVHPRALPNFLAEFARRSGLPREALAAYPRADVLHPAVGAASLAAKVIRDAYVAFLHTQYGDFGWGYPGERRVQEFLRAWLARHGEFPPICRGRWRSAAKLLAGQLPL